MKTIIAFLLENLNYLHAGTIVQKFSATFKLAVVPAVGISLTEKFSHWYIDNQVFMTLVLTTIIIDMVLGAYVHWHIKEDFSFKKLFWGFFGKTMILVCGYILFEMIHQIVKDVDIVASYFKVTLQLIVILYPAGSAMGNMSLITNGKFPPIGWMKKFERFNNSANIDELKMKKNENEDINNSID